jgi:hypothetical protein
MRYFISTVCCLKKNNQKKKLKMNSNNRLQEQQDELRQQQISLRPCQGQKLSRKWTGECSDQGRLKTESESVINPSIKI